jgi:hypothetical protein
MSNLSVAEVLTKIERRMAFHREKESHHAGREAFHREQRSSHAAELEALSRSYEAFKEVAAAAVALATQTAGAPAGEEPPLGQTILRSRLAAKVAAERPVGQPFGARSVADEVNRRFRSHFKKPVDTRLVSAALRRLHAAGRLQLVRTGRGHLEALYTRRD